MMLRALRSGQRQFSVAVTRPWEDKWLTLPPVSASSSASVELNQLSSTPTTALKWVVRCCPHLPRALVHKLFRLRQVRIHPATAIQQQTFKRVAAKDTLNTGDRILLPQSVKVKQTPTHSHLTPQQINFIRTLVIYKDPAILVLNKPPGMPVQGGINIKRSLDAVAAASLNYGYSQPPRLTETVLAFWSWEGHTPVQQSCIPSSARKLPGRQMILAKRREYYKEGTGHWSLDVLDVQRGWSLLHWVRWWLTMGDLIE